MKKKLITLCTLCLFLLGSAGFAEAAWQPQLLVSLGTKGTTLRLSGNIPVVLKRLDNKKVVWQGKAKEFATLTFAGTGWELNGKKLKHADAAALELTVEDERNLAKLVSTYDSKSYRGALRLVPHKNCLDVINRVTVEEYLQGVVPEEMPPEWNAEAVKAQAVAARTYALHQRKRHGKEGFDVCATTHCQQYGGVAAERTAANQAVKATAGEVLQSRGALVDALFHTDSGGMTENSEDVWGSRIDCLRAAKELRTETYPWEKNITAQQLGELLAKRGKNIGEIKKIELSPIKIGKASKDRTISGRVKSVTFVGKNGRASVTGNDLRNMLGLKSTLFSVSLNRHVVFITGYGWGHGLGMSQHGAKAYADSEHWDYKKILQHYYHGAQLKKLY
ncbi:MAG: SpoIID/LytB domain-containing protein [Selenomonas ruminantium]|jgi:stage II sporulation protein D|uniref:SpoIID/LytB domain-containing protein n=1 Tax=Selenomonas ruminantium TaxID=971 RepID=A0A927WCA1_SELRU|nr:SpoIID/LytB domain-containing protein [Selenomonas ruminantium]MBE6084008.1 SpoIID/LytB domain-containing protein [Selenomonas ruminantium]